MKKKIEIILLIILISIYILCSLFFHNYEQLLIMGGNTIIEYKDNKIVKIKNISKINKRLDYEKYSVYTENNMFEDCYINFTKSDDYENVNYNIYRTSIEEFKPTIQLLAYKGDLNISVASTISSYKMSEMDKLTVKSKLDDNDDISTINFNKITVDLNNDGKKEEIYFINNFNSIENANKIFCYVFLKTSNGEIIDIERSEGPSETYYNVKSYNFGYAIDIDNDSEYEIALSSFYEESPTYYSFYKYNSKKNQIEEIK